MEIHPAVQATAVTGLTFLGLRKILQAEIIKHEAKCVFKYVHIDSVNLGSVRGEDLIFPMIKMKKMKKSVADQNITNFYLKINKKLVKKFYKIVLTILIDDEKNFWRNFRQFARYERIKYNAIGFGFLALGVTCLYYKKVLNLFGFSDQ